MDEHNDVVLFVFKHPVVAPGSNQALFRVHGCVLIHMVDGWIAHATIPECWWMTVAARLI